METVNSIRMHSAYLWRILILLCGMSGLASLSDVNNDEFLQTLEEYEIVTPSRVTRDGRHLTYKLHPGHSLRRRSTDSHVQSDDIIHYNININNETHILNLKRNQHLISPGLVIERKKNRFRNVTDSRFSYIDESKTNCHFNGDIVDQPGTRVAVALCNGMQGFIHTTDEEYFIEPLTNDPLTREGHHRHVVYKRSALPKHLDPLRIALDRHRRDDGGDDSCGVKELSNADAQRERWENHHRRKKKSSEHHRSRRSFSTERYVETLVVVDPSMIKYHKNEHLETYVLTIMNMVAAMFHDATIGNSINIVLVRILLMEEEQEELVITHHADKTLQSFCKFQKKINFKDDDHPNHHDVAVLFTRKNICSRLNEPCGTLGLAQVSGMCQPHRSCSISEDTGLALAYTVAHELGHNFGMHHDGSRNGCEDPPGKQLFIMSPSLVADSLRKSWSNCSKQAITQFIDRDWGYCLDDEPASHDYNYPVLPPGTMYDANHQCRLQYGTDDAEICTNEQDVCSNLWCRTDNKCTTHLEAAAEGTICGTNKWCYEGRCVKIGERPEAINGEWGEWTSWTGCTRTCGGGVSHSQRHCENPAPSHGGKYCLGERKRYRICNTDECKDADTSFNEVQCAEVDYIPYKGKLYKWEHVPTSETPCQLHCKPENHFFSVLMKDIVTDGTQCTSGTRNMCISGRCRHVGCDYVIDSRAREDRCGVCHGDGSTCTTVKSQFNESQGLGYVEAAVIPKGARNIRVEEVAAASNFLALQNSEGEYYLNGHWFIQWSGDYKAAGTTIQYSRTGNKESVMASGPLKEPLHVMLLLQSDNPGVVFEYTIPKDNVTEARKPEFNWDHQPWAHCTSSCGGGNQRSEVVCLELEAGVVDDKYCNISSKPDDMQRVCNDHLCPARWWTGPWQHCSVTCGNDGVHHRTVICVRSLGPDEQIALDDDACIADDKPAETEACHRKEPCPGNSSWIVGEWSSCNGNPCGQRYRKVECKDASIGCEQNEIPVSEMPCSDEPCGKYVTSEWTMCTRSCDHGIQTRQIICEGADFCDASKKPPTQRHCNVIPCSDVSTTTTPTTRDHTTKESLDSESVYQSAPVQIEKEQDIMDNDVPYDSEDKESGLKLENLLNETYSTEMKAKTLETVIDQSSTKDYSIEVEDYTGDNLKTKSETDVNSNNETETIQIDVENLKKVEKTAHDNELQQQHNDVQKIKDKKLTKSIIGSASTDQEEENYFRIDKEGEGENKHKHRHHHGHSEPDSAVESVHQNSNDKYLISEENYVPHDGKYSEHLGTGTTKNSIISEIASPREDKENSKENITKLSSEHGKQTVSKTKLDLPSLPNFNKLPPLPSNKELPSLPNIKDLPPLPKLDELPPINSAELDKLPALGKLSSLGNLQPHPGRDPLPVISDENSNTDLDSKPKDHLNVQLTEFRDSNDLKEGGISSLAPDKASSKQHITSFNDVKTVEHNKNLPLNEIPDEKNRPVPSDKIQNEINIDEKVDKYDIKDVNLNVSRNDKQNISLGESDSLVMTETEKGPILPRVLTVNQQDEHKWMPLDWSECSRNCGGGVRTRVVWCLNSKTGDDVDQTHCDINTKPTAIEDCNNRMCHEWQASEWGQCSLPCGKSIRKRVISCPHDGSCDPKYKPLGEETCDVPECVMWMSGQWSKCTKRCGGGERLRLVQCVNTTTQRPSHGCDYHEKPPERQGCNVDPCKDNNAALSLRCEYNEISSSLCRALRKMGQCQNRFIALKCCKACSMDAHRRANKDRPKGHSLR